MGNSSECGVVACDELGLVIRDFSIVFVNITSLGLRISGFMTLQIHNANAPCLEIAIAWFMGLNSSKARADHAYAKNTTIYGPTVKQKNSTEADIGEENRVHRRVQRGHFTLTSHS